MGTEKAGLVAVPPRGARFDVVAEGEEDAASGRLFGEFVNGLRVLSLSIAAAGSMGLRRSRGALATHQAIRTGEGESTCAARALPQGSRRCGRPGRARR